MIRIPLFKIQGFIKTFEQEQTVSLKIELKSRVVPDKKKNIDEEEKPSGLFRIVLCVDL